MAIGTDAQIEFFGTQDTLGTTAGTVADAAFSVAGDLSTWTNDDDAPFASIILEWDYAVAPDASSAVNLFCRLLNIEGTNDETIPNATFTTHFLASYMVDEGTVFQWLARDVVLPNTKTSQEYEFYIENKTGQTIQGSWDLHVTPKALGPHA